MSGLEAANRGHATAFQLATEFINRLTAARPGTTLVWKNRNALLESRSVPEIAIPFLLRPRVRSGAIPPIAVSTKRATAAKHGNKFLKERIFRPDARTLRSIRRTPTRCLRA